MNSLCNPLAKMEIRFDGIGAPGGLRTVNGARFGMVRNGGTRPHQGVDLFAIPGTPIFSVADGEIVRIRRHHPAYGLAVMLAFKPEPQHLRFVGLPPKATLFALYAHLSNICVALGPVKKGQVIGATGVSGNADQRYPHLHLELRTIKDAGLGLHNRVNPEKIFWGIDYSKPFEIFAQRSRTA